MSAQRPEEDRNTRPSLLSTATARYALSAAAGIIGTLTVIAVLLALQGGGVNLGRGTNLERLIPGDADSVTIWNLERLRQERYLTVEAGDPTAEEFIERQMLYLNRNEAVDTYELTHYIVLHRQGWEPVEVGKGNIDFLYIELDLADAGFRRDNYRGYDLWVRNHAYALIPEEGYVVASASQQTIEAFLNHFHRTDDSTRLDPELPLARVMAEAGKRTAVHAQRGRQHCPISRCLAQAMAPLEYNAVEDNVLAEFILLFRGEESAERAAWDYNQVADHVEWRFRIDVLDLERQGEFVIGQGTGRTGFMRQRR